MAPGTQSVFSLRDVVHSQCTIARQRRQTPAFAVYIDNSAPAPASRPNRRKQQNSSTALIDVTENAINRGTTNQGRKKRSRNAASAREFDVAATSQQAEIQNTQRRQIIRPQEQNAHLRPRSAQSGVQQVIQVVVPPRNPDDSSPPEYRDSSSEEEATPPEPRYNLRQQRRHA